MMSDVGMRSMLQSNDYSDELGLLLREQRRQELSDRDRDLSHYRSGSAPPTVEGSLSAVGGLFGHEGVGNFGCLSEEELRSKPAYTSYYYSNVNLNPRLPPPLLSKEDWRKRIQGTGGSSGLGGIGDRRKAIGGNDDGGRDNRSPFSTQLGFNGKKEENKMPKGASEWGGDGLIGLPGLGLGSRQKSIAEVFQEDISHTRSVPRHPSHSASRNALDDSFELSESHFAHGHQELTSTDALLSGENVRGVAALQNINSPAASQTYASALGVSFSRSTTSDPQLMTRIPSPRIPPVGGGRVNSMDKSTVSSPNLYHVVSAGISEPANLASALSGMSLSTNGVVDEDTASRSHNNFFPLQGDQKSSQSVLAANSYLKGPSRQIHNSHGSSLYDSHNLGSPNSLLNHGLSGYAINPASPSMMGSPTTNLPPLFQNAAAVSAMGASGLDPRALAGGLALGPDLISVAAELQNHSRAGRHNMDPTYLQYSRTNDFAAAAFSDPTMDWDGFENPYMDLLGLQKAYLGTLLLPQKSQYGLQYCGKSGNLSHDYYGTPAFGVGMSYPVLPNSPIGSRYGEQNIRFPSGLRNSTGSMMGPWDPEAGGNLDEHFISSLLDEFKTNKTKCFELSEIAGHVVEFSADQYGSRFIQQKLETATTQELNMVFHEIMPQALSLMTDVFGNYVIQKFFEHGTASQIRELANQLTGHVLTLSLQMYGCRVIQKAIEVVDLDQQKEMVVELDGHVIRCVRDQNGNHVIQKCIECIPQEAIQFIISVFYDQVVTLSTHPYGCRVIQRVLEHCSDPITQSRVMDEIMKSVCLLAQDQYGNYVVQHVLEHGKPDERTSIINKLIGQIVYMSQQKFSSNVIEKCLTFGTPEERQILVNEMLGSTDENDPLQVMMKDQFANYVVQKLLETCDDQQLESILNRIKVHLNALKKYTYGKHIVARVEKLVAAGERRISVLSSYAA